MCILLLEACVAIVSFPQRINKYQDNEVNVIGFACVSFINKHNSPLTGCLLTGHGFSCDERHVKKI
jgi:hypothetical protein